MIDLFLCVSLRSFYWVGEVEIFVIFLVKSLKFSWTIQGKMKNENTEAFYLINFQIFRNFNSSTCFWDTEKSKCTQFFLLEGNYIC